MNQILRFLPALRVHSWGGFGSQLFAAYAILKVQKKFPHRRIKVIIHTSGVTRRTPEINFHEFGVKMIQVEDYKNIRNQSKMYTKTYSDHGWSLKINKKILLRALIWSRFCQNANSDKSLDSIKFWTLQLRGHYTRLTLDKNIVESLYNIVHSTKLASYSESNELVVHYRLGDLLSLVEKCPISIQRVESIISKLVTESSLPVLLSDTSGKELKAFLENSKFLQFFEHKNYDPRRTLTICVEAQEFIGTGAKLSLWAAIFRQYLHGKGSFLPLELNWSSGNGLKANWY